MLSYLNAVLEEKHLTAFFTLTFSLCPLSWHHTVNIILLGPDLLGMSLCFYSALT